MLVLVSGATRTHHRFAASGRFGHLITPSGGHRMDSIVAGGLPWAADNDFYWKPDLAAFLRMLDRLASLPGCLFVACPDVVGDARGTRAMFDRWEPEVRSRSLPVALVAQNGIEDTEVPWARMDALFVGGDDRFKEAHSTMELCDEAKRRDKHVHVGRVNTLRRLKKMFKWESVDSIDGSCFSKWPDKYFPWFMDHLDRMERDRGAWTGRPLLWEVKRWA